jgi:hypothetical protein
MVSPHQNTGRARPHQHHFGRRPFGPAVLEGRA